MNEKRLFFLSPYDFLIMLAIYSYVYDRNAVRTYTEVLKNSTFASCLRAIFDISVNALLSIDEQRGLIFFSWIESDSRAGNSR